MQTPWLSVIIPTYNGERYLPTCLTSLVSQNIYDIECISIDDGSSDSTIEILESFSKSFPITILKEKRTGNWAANTNKALSIAKGEYVCFLHQDDLWRIDRLKILRQLAGYFPQIGFFFHPATFIDSNGRTVGKWKCPFSLKPQPISSSVFLESLLIQNFLAIPAPMFKRNIAVSLGGLDEKLWYTADWDFWLKFIKMTDAYFYPDSLASFRIHPESQTVLRSGNFDDFEEQYDIVLSRHLKPIQKLSIRNIDTIFKTARFSAQMNAAIAKLANGKWPEIFKIFISFLALGHRGWRCYLKNSRIFDRISARYKIRLMTDSKRSRTGFSR